MRVNTNNAARRISGFTMVEIALSLAIIGFALVAIIGVLPAGMSVQKDNREQTIINLDAAFLMDAIRTGSQGQDDLLNYVNKITIGSQLYAANGQPLTAVKSTNTYSLGQFSTGAQIIGLLSTPKYVPTNNPFLLFGWGFWSNTVTVNMRAINGPAVDQGLSASSRDFAFQYQVQVEVMPAAEYPFASGTNLWGNLTSPAYANLSGGSAYDSAVAQQLQTNLNEIRLLFRWPLLPGNGTKLGGGRQTFRTSAAGPMTTVLTNGLALYFIQPLVYTPAR